MTYAKKLEFVADMAIENGKMPAGAHSEYLHKLYTSFVAQIRAWESHTIEPYGGSLVLFQAIEANERRAEEVRDLWRTTTAGSCNIVPVPGDHYSLMAPPNVQVLAAHLDRLIVE